MITLSAKEITKAYGSEPVLEGISFHVEQGDRIGMVGANGAGKTTLLKMIAGELAADSGSFFLSENTDIGYLKQADDFSSERTVFQEAEEAFKDLRAMEKELEELARSLERTQGQENQDLVQRQASLQEEYSSKGGYEYKSRLKGILKSMALGEMYFDKKVSTLSGGEKTRLALAILLLKNPAMLLLDEPTNHLDIGTLNWLEQYLKGYRGTLMVVSHDRYFLDKVTNKIFEIEDRRLTVYEGSYGYYASEKKKRREEELRKYNAAQKERKKQEELIRRFKERGTEKLAKRAASREKMLERMESIDRPAPESGKIKIRFKEKFKSGNDVLLAEGLAKSFGYGVDRRQLFENVNLNIKRHDRLCIVGPNGVGKTTLLKILMGDTEPGAGYVKQGHNVVFGYYDQEQKLLNDNLTVLEEVRESYGLYSDTELRNILGRFLFTGDMVFLPVKSLSGGERARLSLLKLMMSGANVLVLDEPTNHLDINSKEVFEDALGDFPGTAIVVSHDRYFLSRIPTSIGELTPEGMEMYPGKYDYYTEKKQELTSGRKYLEEMGKGSRKESGETSKSGGEMSAGIGGSFGDAAFGKKAAEPGSETGGDSGFGTGNTGEKKLSSAEERRLKKEKEAGERRLIRAREKLEREIEELEGRVRTLEEEMLRPEVAKDHIKLAELSDSLDRCNEELAAKYEEWAEL